MVGFPEGGVLPPLPAGTRYSVVSATQLLSLTTSREFVLRLLPARIMVQQYDGANLHVTLQPLSQGEAAASFGLYPWLHGQ